MNRLEEQIKLSMEIEFYKSKMQNLEFCKIGMKHIKNANNELFEEHLNKCIKCTKADAIGIIVTRKLNSLEYKLKKLDIEDEEEERKKLNTLIDNAIDYDITSNNNDKYKVMRIYRGKDKRITIAKDLTEIEAQKIVQRDMKINKNPMESMLVYTKQKK